MDKYEFINLLQKASDLARDFAKKHVTNQLPNSYLYLININEPYSKDELIEDEQCFPEEAMPYDVLTGPLSSEAVASRLWKNGKVPVWIDISAYKADNSHTYMRLLCCSRHSALQKLYYYEMNETGPFGIKSPDLPPKCEIENNGKFNLHYRFIDMGLEEKIIALLAEERGMPPFKIKQSSRLFEDLGMDGDDACEFFEKYSEEFNVDVSNIQWDRHFGPEGFNPLALFMPSFWRRNAKHCSVTVEDLIVSAKAGKWVFDYKC